MTAKEKTALERVLISHAEKYPEMHPCDGVKLIFQNEFGGGHLIPDREKALARLRDEYAAIPKREEGPCFELIGNGLVRVMLNRLDLEKYPLEKLCEDFARSAERHTGNRENFLAKLDVLKSLAARGIFGFSLEELEAYLAGYMAEGCPPVSHSEDYRKAYRPAYRVVMMEELSCLSEACSAVLKKIEKLSEARDEAIVAIDGRCASGKTTLAAQLAELCGCSVVHMDDFFLRPEQRTEERFAQPGGNVDRERFLEEVLFPLRQGKQVVYRPFDCGSQQLGEPLSLEKSSVTLVEGSYSCHPDLAPYYDLKVFLTVSPEEQMARIRIREGEAYARVFRDRWIPLEERYFTELDVEERCDLSFDMTKMR